MNPETAFVTALPSISQSSFTSSSATLCPHSPPPTHPVRTPARMEASPPVATTSKPPTTPPQTATQVPANWPPSSMTDEWAEAVVRLAGSFKQHISLESADSALEDADGDEMLALEMLMNDNRSEIQMQRERAVERARANGDLGRVSAVKEAQLRRKATGSARDFFKGYVELEGSYIDAGYVDESADAMGKVVDTFKGWFGKK